MAPSTDLEQQTQGRHHQRGHHGRSTGTERPAGSSCNAVRGVAAILDPGQVCCNPGPLVPSCFSRCLSGPPPLSPPPRARVLQVWPGKNVFFWDGRVICGPDPRGLILTTTAILLSEWIFLAFVVDGSSTHPTLILASSLILAAMMIATLLLTATSDPGIIPRNQEVSPADQAGQNIARRTPSRFMTVNGVEIRLRFCRVCKIFRPPRSSHCTVCDNCVDKFDHHCAWTSQCIGLRNYRLYLLLVCSALALYAFILPFTVRRIRTKLGSTRRGLFSGLIALPETFALAAFSFWATCFFAYLLAYNAFLVAKNKTSHERHKDQHRGSPNPYDEGTLGNIKECLFEKLPPPRVDFRAVAEPNRPGPTPRTTANDPCPGGACRLPTSTGR